MIRIFLHTFRFLPAALICFLVACSASQTAQRTGDGAFSSREFLKQINAVRAKGCNCGGRKYAAVPALSWNDKLENTAAAHSSYMLRTGRLSHTGRNGASPEKRVSASGYRWRYVAENIAMGPQSIREVVQTWLQSPAHCRNIMSRSATEIGAARSGAYWTLVLATPD
ncbi:CAP domain-containing protein [Niabella aurantiaca]|uniref:CAP domain-containing protein n=1 Tax=Niabella aurantiaca TaxID=379900 RepID=UPI00036F1656|nr:CAP domain-containing protein [Niabella aurantiaca]